jgi:class 3 adenylate cyclase
MPAPDDTILLYADIVGYTRLLRADREDALAKLEQFQDTMRSQVKEHEGRILQAQRDSCLAGFERAGDAIRCAEALQETFQGDASIPVRMGLHAGTVVEKDGHAFGEGVVAVMQLERVGEAGSVVLSQAVQSQLPDQEEWATEPLGPFDLKNREQPIELYALAGKGLTIPDRPQPEETSSDRQRWSHALKLFAGYLVAAWTVLQFVDWLLMRYQISPYWTDILLWTFVGIIPSLLIYLVHQDRFHELRLLRREKIIIPLNILFVLGGLGVAYGGAELGSITRSISFTDVDGSTVTQTIVKPEFVQEISLFPFEEEDGADSTAWLSRALIEMIRTDIVQDKYLVAFVLDGTEAVDKINAAQLTNGSYYVDGKYRVTDTGFVVTPALRDKVNGSVVSERTFRGENIFDLVDSISIYLRREIGITPTQMRQSVDLEVKDYWTDNFAALRSATMGDMGSGNIYFERALELDSTFAVASATYASILHHAPPRPIGGEALYRPGHAAS